MIFAAGFGARMGVLTRDMPKPLLKVAGRTLLDHALEVTDHPAVSRRVVNAHYRADQIAHHLQATNVALSHEAVRILETGGGLRFAMPLLADSPVLTLNSDAVWAGRNPVQELAEAWDPDRMDALLLLAPVAAAKGFGGTGDFCLDASGRLARADGRPGFAYLGAQILRTDILTDIPQQVFSLNLVWNRMIALGRAYGVLHQGQWCDVGRPEGIAEAEALLNWPTHG